MAQYDKIRKLFLKKACMMIRDKNETDEKEVRGPGSKNDMLINSLSTASRWQRHWGW